MSAEWTKRFGAKRRAIDRALLQEAERAIPGPQKPQEPPRPISVDIDTLTNDEALAAIARAFGRPLQ